MQRHYPGKALRIRSRPNWQIAIAWDWFSYERTRLVNTISPGYIGTKMVMAIPKEVLDTKILPQIPLGRLGAPEEIAGLIIYLCSDEAAFVTGANIAINGGQHMQ
jgi:NAD(P)-dependent dehydrogenase (short-subunit alcohol dehydrogenase family)